MDHEDEDVLVIKDDSDNDSFLGTNPGIVYPYSDESFEEFCQEMEQNAQASLGVVPTSVPAPSIVAPETEPSELKLESVPSVPKTKHGYLVKKKAAIATVHSVQTLPAHPQVPKSVPTTTKKSRTPKVATPKRVVTMLDRPLSRPLIDVHFSSLFTGLAYATSEKAKPPVRSSTATSSTPMDTMPAGRSPVRFPTFEETRQTIRDKLISRLGPIVPKPALTLPIPVSTVHARLGPRPPPESLVPFEFRHEERSSDGIEQAASSTTSLKRPRGPENRPARNKAFFKAKVEELSHIPEKRRVPFRHPYQWVPSPENDSEHSDEFDEPNPYERDVEERYVRSVASWKAIYHKDRTAREYAECFIADRTPHLMMRLSKQTAQNMIDSTYKVGARLNNEIIEFHEGTGLDRVHAHPIMKGFIEEIKEIGFCSFDTEGNGKLPRKFGDENRLFVAISSPKTGTILFFHDALDIGDVLKKVLADYTIAKIQSGIGGDVALMQDVGIDVRGVVDSGTLFLLLKPNSVESGFGAKHQVEAIWPGETVHVPYDWKKMNNAYRTQRLNDVSKRHVVQDVLTPYAVLFASAIKRVLADQADEKDIMPFVQEALELCYTKEPIDLRQKLGNKTARQLWIPPVQGSEFSLNSRKEMTFIRRARGNYVERFPGASLREREESAHDLWDGHDIPGQRNLDFRSANWVLRMSDWCQNCASNKHKTSECPFRRTPCSVEHYRGINHPPHSIIACPQLHSFCHTCKIRGHLEQLHPNLELTPRELRQDFMQNCHRGIYTSLPYMYDAGPEGLIQNHHWHAAMNGQRFLRGQSDMWLYRGLSARIPDEFIEKRKRREAIVEANLTSTAATYETIPD